jgi:hypothetical protein
LQTRIKRLARKTICFSHIWIYPRCCHRAVYQSLRIWLNYLELNQTTSLEHYPEADIRTRASFAIEDGQPGDQPL